MNVEGSELLDQDVDDAFAQRVLGGFVACDIETTGLNPRTDRIATIQMRHGEEARLVRVTDGRPPRNIVKMMEDANTKKVFHHAPFDLTFMARQWNLRASNVACTKIAAKLAEPGLASSEYSLKPLLARHLGVEISKDEQTSDWASGTLSNSQVEYALRDVEFLDELLQRLTAIIEKRGDKHILDECFRFLPIYVDARVVGVDDLFGH